VFSSVVVKSRFNWSIVSLCKTVYFDFDRFPTIYWKLTIVKRVNCFSKCSPKASRFLSIYIYIFHDPASAPYFHLCLDAQGNPNLLKEPENPVRSLAPRRKQPVRIFRITFHNNHFRLLSALSNICWRN
jgi:hypothetical protein